MNINFKQPLIFFFGVTIIISGIIFAGSLNPSSTPAPSGYTLGDVYNLIVNNSTTTSASHSLSTSTSPSLTFHSTSEIYALLANLIQRENIETGVTYLGITGDLSNPDSARPNTFVIPSSLSTTSAPAQYGYSLDDIYNLIVNNSTTTSASHSLSTSTSPSASMHTITEIYNALTTLINASKVAVGTTYLAVNGTLSLGPPSPPACGTTITESLSFSGNMSCPGTNGINVGTNNLTINCNGGSITGNGSEIGINAQRVTNTGYNITVQNCTISNFAVSINANGNGENDGMGFNGGNITISSSTVAIINNNGAYGTFYGGGGGTVSVTNNSIVATINSNGAEGGGFGGNGGTVTFEVCPTPVPAVSVLGGTGGDVNGSAGTITPSNCHQ